MLFRRGEAVKYISHLDLMRLFVRACRRAGLPLAYSGGFSPSPAISFALPLAVGVVGEQELVELGFREAVSADEVVAALRPQLPPDVEVLEAWPASGKPLARLIVAADYVVCFETTRSRAELEEQIGALLAREAIPIERDRGGKRRSFDLRPLILSLELSNWQEGEAEIRMRLVAEQGRAGRPDDVLAALGIEDTPARYRRVALHFREPIR
ncbi:MAG: TIGR03936 family radical SAM-associated protein [Chloroflexota bacterium]|nr:TIGR03936 family radical SAM-associated protein [Dehalococcoidia bacterium]MDW8254646.1 TIGR03936 family radical SAM-associated protein [Chloroflexota bacterium]